MKNKANKNNNNDKALQSAELIMMIRPASFRMNEQTAVNNLYQQAGEHDIDTIDVAREEFDGLVDVLKAANVDVVVFEDDIEADTPDALFPNNWVSFHADGRVGLYPMFAVNRRPERREALVYDLRDGHGLALDEFVDFTEFEDHDRFLEGTGSLVLDRAAGVAYAAISPRTDREAAGYFGETFEMQMCTFTARQNAADEAPIYHTNVMMAIGTAWAVVCSACIRDAGERRMVLEQLVADGHEIIDITTQQVDEFAGNVLEVRDRDGGLHIAMSSSAHAAFTSAQLDTLKNHGSIIHAPIPTIEQLGGGSVRCMLAEVFLPKS
jgi:hypothetical protein